MNRRQLLKYLAGGVVSVATGEVLVPAARTYFLPPRGGWITFPKPSAQWGTITGAVGLDDLNPLYYDEEGIKRMRRRVIEAIAEEHRVPERYLSGEFGPVSETDLGVMQRYVALVRG